MRTVAEHVAFYLWQDQINQSIRIFADIVEAGRVNYSNLPKHIPISINIPSNKNIILYINNITYITLKYSHVLTFVFREMTGEILLIQVKLFPFKTFLLLLEYSSVVWNFYPLQCAILDDQNKSQNNLLRYAASQQSYFVQNAHPIMTRVHTTRYRYTCFSNSLYLTAPLIH